MKVDFLSTRSNDLELQVKDAINSLKPLIPLSFEPVRIAFQFRGLVMVKQASFYDHIWIKKNGFLMVIGRALSNAPRVWLEI